MKRKLLTLLLLSFSTPVFAQNVTFSGKVEDGEGVCYYCPGFDYVIDLTHTSLTSSTINLAPFVGRYVVGTGQWDGSTATPAVDVTSIALAPQSFSIGGGGSLGSQIKFSTFSNPGDIAYLLVAFDDGFVRFSNSQVQFLDPATAFVFRKRVIPASGEFKVRVNIPNDPSLIGLPIFGQSVLVTPTDIILTNSDLKVIRA